MKNRSLELWRFIFSIAIALYHFRAEVSSDFLPSGYMAVEFFFIISGYLMAASATNVIDRKTGVSPEISTLKYITNKIKRLYPHYIFSFTIFIFISVAILRRYSLKHVLRFAVPEICMLQMSGLANTKFTGNAADWYVSSLMIASFILFYLTVKYADCFKNIICPIVALTLYTYQYHEIGHLGSIRGYHLNTYAGTLRAIAGMCLGCICYQIVQYIKCNLTLTSLSKICLTIIDVVCIGLIAYRFFAPWKTTLDFLLLPIYMFFTINIFLQESKLQKLLDNSLSFKLGSISYAIFLNHTIIRDVFKALQPVDGICQRIALYLVCVISSSILSHYVVGFVCKKINIKSFFYELSSCS